MAWTPSIKLAVAHEVFPQFNIQAHEVSCKVAYYSAQIGGQLLEDRALTNLCKRIVENLAQQQLQQTLPK